MLPIYLGRFIHESLMNAVQAGDADRAYTLTRLLFAFVRLYGELS